MNKALVIAAIIIIAFTAKPSTATGSIPASAKAKLPSPVLDGSPEFIELYWKSWEIALTKIRSPRPGSGFASDYMDEGFSENIFQWDTCFMVMFGRYGQDAVPGIKSFDNFYKKQHEDGFIDREISEIDGTDKWGSEHNNSINPPLFAWVEWENYKITGDSSRMKRVYPKLKKYYEWIKANRRHPNGMYWTTNLASGMDNSPRGMNVGSYEDDKHFNLGWVDITAQQALSAMYLTQIAKLAGQPDDIQYFKNEYDGLVTILNNKYWYANGNNYYDIDEKDKPTRIKTIASFWPMLAGVPNNEQARLLVEKHLKNKKEFWRPHPFPTLSRDHLLYAENGGYWRGAVWAPTEYMIIRGLLNYGFDDFAAEAVELHLSNMYKVMKDTGTIFENYAPETAAKGQPAMGNFVGWSGVGPIAMLIENIIGLRADAPANSLLWRIRRTDRHGIENFRFGDNTISLIAAPRADSSAVAKITITTDSSFTLTIDHPLGVRDFKIEKGKTEISIP